jgi:small subunit ribosomal protein S18
VTRERSGRPRWNRPRYAQTRKVCAICAGNIKVIDYKDTETLSGFITDRGKIATRRRTGACAKHQRIVARAIKRARHIALLPYVPIHAQKAESASTGD